MNRRSWLRWLPAALFPVAAKAETVMEVPQWHTPLIDKNHVFTGEYAPPMNNQCPVCGTLHEKYKRKSYAEEYGWVLEQDERGLTYQGLQLFRDVKEKPHAPVGPSERSVRCGRCNASFWQDAE